MVKGYPDYYRGSILFGLKDGVPVGINMDDAGNLVAMLKAMFGATPTTLACDVDGNLKVNIEVQSSVGMVEPAETTTVFKTTEQVPLTSIQVKPLSPATTIPVTESAPLTSIQVKPLSPATTIPVTESAPLTSIQVKPLSPATTIPVTESAPLTSIQIEPKSGAADLNVKLNSQTGNANVNIAASGLNVPISIAAQTLAAVNISQAAGTFAEVAYGTALNAAANADIFDVSGKLFVQYIDVSFNSTIAVTNAHITFTVDGVEMLEITFDSLRTGYSMNGTFWPFGIRLFDDKLFKYTLFLKSQFTCKTSLKINISNTDAQTLYQGWKIGYFAL